MFSPSLFSSFLIERIGVKTLILSGIALQISSNLVGIQTESNAMFLWSLLLLGISWNFLYMGSTYIIGTVFSQEEKFKAQGINDTIVHVFSTCGAMFSGALLALFRWQYLNLMSLLLISILLLAYIFTFKNTSIAKV